MRIFKMTYKANDGKLRQARKWSVEFRDHRETIQRMAGFTDKAQAKAMENFKKKLSEVELPTFDLKDGRKVKVVNINFSGGGAELTCVTIDSKRKNRNSNVASKKNRKGAVANVPTQKN